MTITLLHFFIISLGIYRMSFMIRQENGPFNIMHPIRQWLKIDFDNDMQEPLNWPDKFWPIALTCVRCISMLLGFITFGMLLIISADIVTFLWLPWALSGVSVLLIKL